MANDLQSASALLEAGKKADAGNIFARLVKTDPNDERAWFGLSVCVVPAEQKKYCLEQVLRINPQNQYARKKLTSLESVVNPPFQNAKPASPSVASHRRGFSMWLLALFAVIAIVVIVVVGLFNVWNLSILATTPTPNWGLEVLPSGSSLEYDNWSVRVDGIVTKQTVSYYEIIDYPLNGRFAVLYFSVINTGSYTDTYVPISSIVIMDRERNIFPVSLAESAAEALSRNWKFALEIRPGQQGKIIGVYDISLASDGYLLLVRYSNVGVLLDIPQ